MSIEDINRDVKDTSWLQYSFLSQGLNINDRDRYQRSRGWMKFMDTTLGGNSAINAPYQFCRYADIPERRLIKVGKGMGRWYSENIDDWGHNIHFRMGVPSYTGIVPFALKAIDGATARYVATGREPGFMDALGRVAAVIVSVAFWELTLLSMFINTLIDLTHSRYYYLKPTMWQYWRTVQLIVNNVAANLGVTMGVEYDKSRVNPENSSALAEDANPSSLYNTKTDLNLLAGARNALPDVFRTPVISTGTPDIGIDVHAVASRAQGLQVQFQEEMIKTIEKFNINMSPQQMSRQIEEAMRGSIINRGNNKDNLRPVMINGTLDAYQKSFASHPWYTEGVNEKQSGAVIKEYMSSKTQDAGDNSGFKKWFEETVDSFSGMIKEKGQASTLHDKLLAELRDGSQWCSFRINNATDSITESISNSSEKSEVSSIFNDLSQKFKSAKFNMGGGKTGIKPLDMLAEAGAGVMDSIIAGATDTVSFLNPVIGLMYGAQIEIPKRWSSSSTSLSTTTVNLELRAGYGNVISYMQDIIIPLAMCMAMALPRGTGAQSYGSPFYVQYYNKGRSQVRVGLVSSLTITRGKGNAPWHRRGWPMGVDISMTIEDMSEIMFSPSAQGLPFKTNLGGSIFGNPMEENAMGDYLAVLSALGMNEQEYFGPRMKRRFNNLVNSFNSWLSPSRWMALSTETAVGQAIVAFSQATNIRN